MAPETGRVPGAIRILIVDDHPAVREGLALLLAPEGITVCAEADGRAEAIALLSEFRPDVALVDLSLGDEDGIALVADLCARGVEVLVYSMHEDSRHVQRAFAAGALGYVTKREVHRVLVDALRAVADGFRFVSPGAAQALADAMAAALGEAVLRDLSDQERQVFELMGRGEGTVEIAASLGISVRTVETYYARILTKLGIDGMHELRVQAIGHQRDEASR